MDNEPQAQYLSSVAARLRRRGHQVLVTAKDHPQTIEVLANRGEAAVPIGGPFGASRAAKTAGTLLRAARLAPAVQRRLCLPDAVLASSRSANIAGRLLGSRCYTIIDYEGVETSVFRACRTTVLHPSAISSREFTKLGFAEQRLIPFPGLKEDISFSGLDLEEVVPAELPFPRNGLLPAILVRPPSETSIYRVDESVVAMNRILDHLAGRNDVQVVLSPRKPDQARFLTDRSWKVPPVLLAQMVPLVNLLRAVDRVVTGGGTMLREAAWFGIPAVSVFQGRFPSVDKWLETKGAIERLRDGVDPASIPWNTRAITKGMGTVNTDALETVISALES